MHSSAIAKSIDQHEEISTSKLVLTDSEFSGLCDIIKDLTGISMGESKRQLVYRRLSGRLKHLKLKSFTDYIEFLSTGDVSELELFSNAVTTNLTSFFRESYHFDYLAGTIIPGIIKKRTTLNNRFRIWSAGCSTGEEAYSIAITLKESLPSFESWDAKILCTDLDSDVINHCKRGIYNKDRIEKMAMDRQKRWFNPCQSEQDPAVKVKKELQDLTTFKQLNLMHEWPMKGRFDVIFCRNVIIYFDKPTQAMLMNRYADIMNDGGYLFLGHSESLLNVTDRFTLIDRTVYRKVC
ncbi:MAG: protein-glutamate O-methyltransferase [Acidiferrobacterales bacterium]|nr:protein-glutamate O-methyltransferase [Acidiferrobacterales bacterium]